MEPSDAALVVQAQAGDAQAFSALVARHYDMVFRLSWRLMGERAEAEDLAQDVCVGLATKIGGFRAEARFSTWLHRVVVNAARDRMRRRASHAKAAAGWGEVELARRAEAAEADASQVWLTATMRTLPDDLRETVALVLGEDLTHAQAAEVLNVSEGTISWRMSETRRRLRQIAEEERA
ncbi:MAG: RNA polymerase sigma factor [Pseudomonadota bacterium]